MATVQRQARRRRIHDRMTLAALVMAIAAFVVVATLPILMARLVVCLTRRVPSV